MEFRRVLFRSRVTSVIQSAGAGRRTFGSSPAPDGIRHNGTGRAPWRVRGCSPDGPRIRLRFLCEGGSCAKKLRKNRWQTPSRPVAPRPWDVRRAPGIRTAAGRGYRPRGRPVLSLESREIGRAHAELQSLMRISYAVFSLKKKKKK